jgi:uncharacterized phiE125 gp8 family phage protein
MRITLKTPPDTLPLTLDDVKAYCHIIGSDEDLTLSAIMKTAISVFETLTSRQLCPATYEAILSGETSVILPKSPVIEILSVKDNDDNDVDAEKYSVSFDYDVAKIEFNSAFSGKITFKAGFTAIPDDILGYIRAKIASIYENREDNFKTSLEEYIANTYKVSYML